MKYKPLIIVLGEPYSVFIEIFLKTYKSTIKSNFKIPILLVGSLRLLEMQMKFFTLNSRLLHEAIKSAKASERKNEANNTLSEVYKTILFGKLLTTSFTELP